MTFLCISPICGPTCSGCNQAISPADQLKYAKRYAFLRQAGAWESEIGLNILSEKPAKFDEAVDVEIEVMK